MQGFSDPDFQEKRKEHGMEVDNFAEGSAHKVAPDARSWLPPSGWQLSPLRLKASLQMQCTWVEAQ